MRRRPMRSLSTFPYSNPPPTPRRHSELVQIQLHLTVKPAIGCVALGVEGRQICRGAARGASPLGRVQLALRRHTLTPVQPIMPKLGVRGAAQNVLLQTCAAGTQPRCSRQIRCAIRVSLVRQPLL